MSLPSGSGPGVAHVRYAGGAWVRPPVSRSSAVGTSIAAVIAASSVSPAVNEPVRSFSKPITAGPAKPRRQRGEDDAEAEIDRPGKREHAPVGMLRMIGESASVSGCQPAQLRTPRRRR